MYTINLTTSTRTTEGTSSREIVRNLTANTKMLINWATATQLSLLVTCGTTKRKTLRVEIWISHYQLFHAVSLQKVFSTTHMF